MQLNIKRGVLKVNENIEFKYKLENHISFQLLKCLTIREKY